MPMPGQRRSKKDIEDPHARTLKRQKKAHWAKRNPYQARGVPITPKGSPSGQRDPHYVKYVFHGRSGPPKVMNGLWTGFIKHPS